MRTISVDFESYYEKSKEDGACSIITLGARKYCMDPRTDPYLISVSDGAETWAGHPRDFNFAALEGQTLLSHNAGFDSLLAKEKIKSGVMPKFTPAAWHCTANMSVYMSMRRDLLRASEFLLGVVVDKSYREDADSKTWEQMVAAGSGPKVLQAGREDAYRCWQLWAKYGHLWPEHERKLSELTIRQGQRGVQIDEAKLKLLLTTAQQMAIQSEERMPWIAEGKKPRSTKAIAELCRKSGIPMPPVKKHDGEEAFDEWVLRYGPKFPWVKAFADYAVINKFIANCETFRDRLDAEKVLSFDLLYFGAHTGRWSGAGGINFQNFRKEPLYCDTDGLLITDDARLKEIRGSKKLPGFVACPLDIRSLIIPRAGKKMITSDLSQIEPRVLAWLVNDTTMLASMAAGQSPYEAHGRATMGWTGGDMKKENKELYALAKARVLGLGYGCGWKKFITVAMNMAGLDITKDDPEFVPVLNEDGSPAIGKDGQPKMESGYGTNSRRIVKDYRESNPLITGLWRRLDDILRESIGRDFTITLPSGRQLRYPEVLREFKAVADPENPGKWSRKWSNTALAYDQKRNGVVRKPFYGGLLTENLVQAAARDVFAGHLLALDSTPGVEVLFSVHDEAVCEVDQHVTTKDIEQIMAQVPDWLEGCPVSAEAAEVPCYCK